MLKPIRGMADGERSNALVSKGRGLREKIIANLSAELDAGRAARIKAALGDDASFSTIRFALKDAINRQGLQGANEDVVPLNVTTPPRPAPPAVATAHGFRVAELIFGSLLPAPTGDDAKDRKVLGEFLGKNHLTVESLSTAAAIPNDGNLGLTEALRKRRQSFFSAMLAKIQYGMQLTTAEELESVQLTLKVEKNMQRKYDLAKRETALFFGRKD